MGTFNIRSSSKTFTSVEQANPQWVSLTIDTGCGLTPAAFRRKGEGEKRGFDSLIMPCRLRALESNSKLVFDKAMIYRTMLSLSDSHKNHHGALRAVGDKALSLVDQLGLHEFLPNEGTVINPRDYLWLHEETRIDNSTWGNFVAMAVAINAKISTLKAGQQLSFDAQVWTYMNQEGTKFFAGLWTVSRGPGHKGEEGMTKDRYRRDGRGKKQD